MTKHIFIGFDPRDELAGQVAVRSLLRHSTMPDSVKVHFLRDHELRRAGMYWRQYEVRPNGQIMDLGDGKPCSTMFSFTRFCVPELARSLEIHEPVLFVDPDVMFRAPVEDIFGEWRDEYAVMCVQHNHVPPEGTKFDGLEQTRYFRKNWSSVMLLHPDKTKALTLQKVNNQSGAQLHAMLWANDSEIGALPKEWNHLVGYNEPNPSAKLVHFTLGTPDIPGRERDEYADEWRAYVKTGEMPVHYPHSNVELSKAVWKGGGQ
jgi:hypothetical protein